MYYEHVMYEIVTCGIVLADSFSLNYAISRYKFVETFVTEPEPSGAVPSRFTVSV